MSNYPHTVKLNNTASDVASKREPCTRQEYLRDRLKETEQEIDKRSIELTKLESRVNFTDHKFEIAHVAQQLTAARQLNVKLLELAFHYQLCDL